MISMFCIAMYRKVLTLEYIVLLTSFASKAERSSPHIGVLCSHYQQMGLYLHVYITCDIMLVKILLSQFSASGSLMRASGAYPSQAGCVLL